MTKDQPKSKADRITATNKTVSRPEDSATHRQQRIARLLRMGQLSAAGPMMEREDSTADSETEAALRRATDDKEDGGR
jgi:hypothetical protein